MKKASFVNPNFYMLILKSNLYQSLKEEPIEKSSNFWKKKKKPQKLKPILSKNFDQPLVLFCRNTTLCPHSLGFIFLVHNGLVYLKILVSEYIIGHKLGEFSQTRKRYFYKNRKNKKKKRRS